jgi:hypothetical protein
LGFGFWVLGFGFWQLGSWLFTNTSIQKTFFLNLTFIETYFTRRGRARAERESPSFFRLFNSTKRLSWNTSKIQFMKNGFLKQSPRQRVRAGGEHFRKGKPRRGGSKKDAKVEDQR